MHTYKTHGTCSVSIEFDVQDDILTHVAFTRGCNGNLRGISKLVVGMKVDDVIEKLEGIQCRGGTSCPDQLARALISYKNSKAAVR